MQHVMFQIQCFSSFLSFLPKKQSKAKCIKLEAYLTDDEMLAKLTGSKQQFSEEKSTDAYLLCVYYFISLATDQKNH